MSAKREYLRTVFESTSAITELVQAALIFYHAEVPAEQARQYIQVLATKTKKENDE